MGKHLLQNLIQPLQHDTRILQDSGGYSGIVKDLLGHFRGECGIF